MKRYSLKSMHGVYTIEFTMISAIFLLTVFVIIDIAKIMYLMNAAGEITRRGARTAVVCGIGANGIFSEMSSRFPNLTPQNVNISYLPAGCTQATCSTVTVALTGVTNTVMGITVNFPDFSTTLPRESMDSTLNPVCG